MKIFIIIINLLLITCPLYSAANDGTGTTSGAFLKIPTSSRQIGRGEAFTAMVDDPSALTVNVAGLGTINDMEILFSHYEWLIDLDYEHLAIVKPAFKGLYGSQGVIGAGITYLHLPPFNEYGSWGERVGELNYNAMALIAGYGQKLAAFDVGFSFKFLREQVDIVSDYTFGFDIGTIYSQKLPKNFLWLPRTFGRVVKIGLTVQNIGFGTGIKGYKIPTIIKSGIGTEILNDFQVEFGLEKPFDSRIRLNLGMEYNIRNYVNIRAGYRFHGYEIDSFTLGLGVRYPFGSKLVKIDAAYAPEGTLRNTANLSFGIKFPGVIKKKDWKMANRLYYKGIYYYTKGELEKAIELWKEVLKYSPKHTQAIQKIKDALYLLELKEIEKKVEEEFGELKDLE